MMSGFFSDAFLEGLRELVESSFTDPCTIYHRLDVESPAVPGMVSDGQGGFAAHTDAQGGSVLTYDSGTQTTCRLDELTGGGYAQKQDVAVQKTRQNMYLPWDTAIGRFDKVVTAAGNNGVNRTFHVLDIYRATDETDLGILVEEISTGG